MTDVSIGYPAATAHSYLWDGDHWVIVMWGGNITGNKFISLVPGAQPDDAPDPPSSTNNSTSSTTHSPPADDPVQNPDSTATSGDGSPGSGDGGTGTGGDASTGGGSGGGDGGGSGEGGSGGGGCEPNEMANHFTVHSDSSPGKIIVVYMELTDDPCNAE